MIGCAQNPFRRFGFLTVTVVIASIALKRFDGSLQVMGLQVRECAKEERDGVSFRGGGGGGGGGQRERGPEKELREVWRPRGAEMARTSLA